MLLINYDEPADGTFLAIIYPIPRMKYKQISMLEILPADFEANQSITYVT